MQQSIKLFRDSVYRCAHVRTSPDVAAWAAIALQVCRDADTGLVRQLLHNLSDTQTVQGCIPLRPEAALSIWPTPLAVLAWKDAPEFASNRDLACRYLLNTSGNHWPVEDDAPTAHDTSLRGWSWLSGTHSWVQPTALSLLALYSRGIREHARIDEAVSMLMDRQLPQGGWNYGNTVVFGTTLHPSAESTALALCALHGQVPDHDVALSLGYLTTMADTLCSPLSLAWALLGLATWGKPLNAPESLIHVCLQRQAILGPYSLDLLAQLIVAGTATDGIHRIISRAGES